MILSIFVIVILAIVVEAVTEIVVESEFPLFYYIRHKLSDILFDEDTPPDDNVQHTFLAALYKLLTCGYCFSVWTAAIFAFFVPLPHFHPFAGWIVATFLLHRLSNLYHVLFELVKRGRVHTYDITVRDNEE